VFPDADVKVFLDADPEVRAERRLKDLAEQAAPATRDQVLRDLRERDTRDRTRSESPLLQAPDAIYVDSTNQGIDEVEEMVLRLIRQRISNGKEFER
jgi:cytidylate kinase